jgi:PTH1 family peptidyl-tRNA hydrolase
VLKLIVGIGNPGSQYAQTRHNAGAWFIEALLQHYQLTLRLEKKFALELAELKLGGHNVIIAKTTTYMNESGQAVGACAKFFQIQPSEILIAHDELDLQSGAVRLKIGGGHGGHNGLRSILSHLGSPDFYRLRLGIGHPGHKDLVHDYVLHRPSVNDKIAIELAIDKSVALLPELLDGEFNKVMKTLHTGELT